MSDEPLQSSSTSVSTDVDTSYTSSLGPKATEINRIGREVEQLRDEIKKSKFDLVALLGVFTGFITYLGLEIQVFKLISNPLLIIGISFFFISSILLFVLAIQFIVMPISQTNCKMIFKNPLYITLFLILSLSMIFILWGNYDYKRGQSYLVNRSISSNIILNRPPATSSSNFDLLWAEFFATGDAAPVQKI